MVSRLAFYPSLLYNVILERIVPGRHWYDRINDHVILGALPFRSITPQLQKEGVTGVLTMNEEFETRKFVHSKEEWLSQGIDQLRIALPDFISAPSVEQMEQGITFIEKHKQSGGCVYVHCKAGRTRSASIVAAYLMKTNKWSPQEAVKFIKSKRPHVAIRQKQWRCLNEFSETLTKSLI